MTIAAQPPVQGPVLDQQGNFVFPWIQWLLSQPVTMQTPASATAQGQPGQIAYDGNFLYVAVAVNTWRRVALSAW